MDVRRKAGINNDGWAGGERVLALIPREATLMEKERERRVNSLSGCYTWLTDVPALAAKRKIEECKLPCFDCPASTVKLGR